MKNIVAIVGRPNVGKSTLFNRLIEKKNAITSEVSGTTRDRNYGECIWNNVTFSVIDTGGFNEKIKNDKIKEEINKQIKISIDEASVILFLVDCHDGITDVDKIFANVLRKDCSGKKIYVVANKADNKNFELISFEFMQFGFGEPIKIAANSGSGTGELLDIITSNFSEKGKRIENIQLPKFAIIGQPNVGKSSLLNVLVGEERAIINNESGTTRDSINSLYNLYGQRFILIDTAGIRKKNKKKEDIEFYSTLRSINAIEESDICIYLLDAQLGLEKQDLKLINLAVKRNCGVVLVVNKIDLITPEECKNLKKDISERLKNVNYIPIICVSVLKKKNIFKIIQKAVDVYKNKTTKISTPQLNNILLPIIEQRPPQGIHGKEIKIKYITQLHTNNIIFVFFCNFPEDIRENYKHSLEKEIRKNFNFEGNPIKLIFRKK